MLRAQLYFLSNEYYQDFPDDKLMQNKDTWKEALMTDQEEQLLCGTILQPV
ncbi:MAG: hypothetical protein KH268_04610 [Clostridiales bacterium]|nr:hypothetical protein [Clostridiales bacterium]